MTSPLARIARLGLLAAAVALLVADTAGTAAATPVPEITPGAIGGAMTLLAGGLLLVRERLRSDRR